MQLHVLMAQREEAYPGEYAPEALDVIDEIGHSDNPDFLERRAKEARETGEFESVAIITIEVDGDAVMAQLRPSHKPLVGRIAP